MKCSRRGTFSLHSNRRWPAAGEVPKAIGLSTSAPAAAREVAVSPFRNPRQSCCSVWLFPPPFAVHSSARRADLPAESSNQRTRQETHLRQPGRLRERCRESVAHQTLGPSGARIPGISILSE